MGLKIGDYVLATKYKDGDPCDHFCVGRYSGHQSKYGIIRHFVVDSDGNLFRHNGFSRCEKISSKIGNLLVRAMPIIGDVKGKSIWYWRYHPDQLERLMNN